MHNTNINSDYRHFFYYYSDSKWSNSQRVTIQQQQLQFGMAAPVFTNATTIISRGISTVPLTLSIAIMSTTTATDAIATTEIIDTTEISTTAEEVDTQSQTGAMATTQMSTTTASAEILEDNILEHIRETPTFNRIHALVSVVGG